MPPPEEGWTVLLSADVDPWMSCHLGVPDPLQAKVTKTGLSVLQPAPPVTRVTGIFLALLHTVGLRLLGASFRCAQAGSCPEGDVLRFEDKDSAAEYVIGQEVCHEHELWEATLLTAEPSAREAHIGPAGITMDCCDRSLADHKPGTLRVNFLPESGLSHVAPFEIRGYWCEDTFYPLPAKDPS